MESTAQYWKPVWQALEQYWKAACQKREGAGPKSGALHLAQAKSNRGPRGRKNDFADAERLVKRLVAQETHPEFRARNRTAPVADSDAQVTCDKVRLQNQLECLLEEAHIELSSLVSDLLGVSARRMLEALADGETNPEALAALADRRLRATPRQLCDALGACEQLNQVYRRLLKMALEELKLLEEQQDQLDKMIWELLALHQDAVRRVAEIPGFGRGLGTPSHRRSRPQGSGFPFRQQPCLAGRDLSRGATERRPVPEQSITEGQLRHAAHSESGCPRRGKSERKHIRSSVLPSEGAPGIPRGHLGHRASDLQADLEDFARQCPL
jgi:hypothetical protein